MRWLLLLLVLCSCTLREQAWRRRDFGPKEPANPIATHVLERHPEPIVRMQEPAQRVDDHITASVEEQAPPRAELPKQGIIREEAVHQVTPPMHEDERQENLMPKKRWNRLAIPALVAALGTICLGLFTSSTYAVLGGIFVTLLLAGISLRRIRIHEQAGKGFAFAALMIGVIAALVTALTIASYGLE